MKLSDTFTFDAEQQAVWEVLMSPEAIAQALPGVEALIPIEGEANAWQATAKLGVASVNGTYTGTIRMTDIDAPTRYTLTVTGQGQQSIINGAAILTLSPAPEAGKTLLTWEADANISGKLASVAQRLIVAAASFLSRQFFQALAKQINSEGAS